MKTFSKHWKESKKPKKQRKYKAKAPLHIKRKFINASLSKELRRRYERRSVPLRKGDTVKVLAGKFKGKKAKISKIRAKHMKIYIEGIQKKKMDGSMVDIPLRASNLQITELDLNDKRRFKKLRESKKTDTKKEEKKKETRNGNGKEERKK